MGAEITQQDLKEVGRWLLRFPVFDRNLRPRPCRAALASYLLAALGQCQRHLVGPGREHRLTGCSNVQAPEMHHVCQGLGRCVSGGGRFPQLCVSPLPDRRARHQLRRRNPHMLDECVLMGDFAHPCPILKKLRGFVSGQYLRDELLLMRRERTQEPSQMDVPATVLDPGEGGGVRLPRRRRGSSGLLTACLCHAVQRMAPLRRKTMPVRCGGRYCPKPHQHRTRNGYPSGHGQPLPSVKRRWPAAPPRACGGPRRSGVCPLADRPLPLWRVCVPL